MQIFKTAHFVRQYKKLHRQDQDTVDIAMAEVIATPLIGVLKRGDLDGVRVHKFSLNRQLVLMAYRFLAETPEQPIAELRFLAVGSHENFYRDLKN